MIIIVVVVNLVVVVFLFPHQYLAGLLKYFIPFKFSQNILDISIFCSHFTDAETKNQDR